MIHERALLLLRTCCVRAGPVRRRTNSRTRRRRRRKRPEDAERKRQPYAQHHPWPPPEYILSIWSLYFSTITRRFSLRLGVSSPSSTLHSSGTTVTFLIVSK